MRGGAMMRAVFKSRRRSRNVYAVENLYALTLLAASALAAAAVLWSLVSWIAGRE
jgi:hypothetical protein